MFKKIILQILFYSFLPFSLLAASHAKPDLSVFPVGVLVNQQSFRGKAIVEAVKLAAQELKIYKTKTKPGFEVKLFIEDTKGNNKLALSQLEKLASQGIHTVIGPQSSEEAEALLSFAKKQNIVLLSPSSSSVRLAKSGDNLLRFCPDDTLSAKATAELMGKEGVRAVVMVYRDDEWGQDLAQAIKENVVAMEGTLAGMISYDPASEDFSKTAALILKSVSSAAEKYGRNATAVVVLGFREVVDIFYDAKRFSLLKHVKWYGSDSDALLKEMIIDRDAAEFAAQTNFRVPVWGDVSNASYRHLKIRLKTRLGQEPDNYAMAAYDALKVSAQAYQQRTDADVKVFINALIQASLSHQGATGSLALGKTGDRQTADFDFWAVRKNSTGYVWQDVGKKDRLWP